MYKAYKYRIYPNKDQEELIQKTFGCCRFVYNQTLAYRKELYDKEGKSMSKFDCMSYVNRKLKIDHAWLKEVDKWSLQNSVANMDNAFQRFFKEHKGYPKFKSKKNNRKAYTTNKNKGAKNIDISFEGNKIKLPKLKWIKVRGLRKFAGTIKSATVSQTPSGKYFVSILVETEHDPLECRSGVVGLDLGIKDLVITSNGNKYENPKTLKKYEKKLAKEQRRLAHKVKGSNNYRKQRIKLAMVYEKIHNIRLDYLHKITHEIIVENQVIVSEDLQVSNMVKNHNLAKSISDCLWYELTRQLQYKAEWNNRDYIKVDRFFASSQKCNVCGYQNKETKDLTVRQWICPECGTEHDRDVNAAKNILNEGLRILTA